MGILQYLYVLHTLLRQPLKPGRGRDGLYTQITIFHKEIFQAGFQAMTIFFKVYPRKKGAMPNLQELERKSVRHDM